MLIRFKPEDKPVALTALDLLGKAAARAVKAYEAVGLPSMAAQALEGGATLCRQRIHGFAAGEEEGTLTGRHELEGELLPALRTALYLLGMEVEKQKEKAIERTVDPCEFDARLIHLRDFRERTDDQAPLLSRRDDAS